RMVGLQSKYNSEERLKKIGTKDSFSALEASTVEWVSDPELSTEEEPLAVDKKILGIVKESENDPGLQLLISSNEQSSPESKRLFHDTISTAMESIASDQALLSAFELRRRGKDITTGEVMEGGGNKIEPDVRASQSGVRGGNNATPKYFGEKIITFIINEARQEQTLRKELSLTHTNEGEIQTQLDKKLRRLPEVEPMTN